MESARIIRFGVFEVDLHAGELRKNGLKIKLQEQPFQILVMLLEKAGDVVTREELCQKLWSTDTFVDFDHSLNTAIKKLRLALGDTADNPRFVETLARRGYRFIVPVETGSTPAGPEAGKEARKASAVGPAPQQAESQPRVWTWPANRIRVLAGVPLVVLIGLGAAWYLAARRSEKAALPLPKVVALTSFAGNETYPAFSPDGNQVAFAWTGERNDNTDIYVQLVGAGRPLRLTTSPLADVAPAWSPDGGQVAFIRYSESETGIYVVPSLGGPEQKLFSSHSPGGYWLQLDWSWDGKLIAFTQKRPTGDSFAVYLLSLGTRNHWELTAPPRDGLDLNPRFSPDGKTVAFARLLSDTQIYVVSVSGGEPRHLTSVSIDDLVWTPDGRSIVFWSNRAGNFDLWRISASGGTPERLAIAGGSPSPPANRGVLSLARNGSRLAYTHSSHDSNIWQVEIPASGQPRSSPFLLISSTRADSAPDVSQDGTRIAFESTRSGTTQIWTCETNGSNCTRLTSVGAAVTGSPRWSPDSRQIAFDTGAFGNADIYVVGADGGLPRPLTIDPHEDVAPTWSRDGKWIYFTSNRSGTWQVWKVPSSGGPAAQVTRHGGFAAQEAADGMFVYYAKGPLTPGLWKVPAEGGEEVSVLENLEVGYWGSWALVETGIFFGTSRPSIYFLDFSTGRIAEVVKLEKGLVLFNRTLTVSPDGRHLIYSQVDQVSSDIMLVENFQ